MKLSDFEAVLLDMDGTLYLEGHALPGVQALLHQLNERGMTVRCVTNNSANTSTELARRLHGFGVEMPAASIYTAAHAMAAWINTLPTPRGLFNFAGRALPTLLNEDTRLIERVDESCDVVAVSTHMRENNMSFDFERSLVGLTHLRSGAHLVVGCADRVFPVAGGGVEFGSGSWAQLFAYAANLPPNRVHYVGKPEPLFFETLCAATGIDPRRCIIVGDNLESDIAGGQRVGMATALVMTGVTRPTDLDSSSIKPCCVFDDLPALLAALS